MPMCSSIISLLLLCLKSSFSIMPILLMERSSILANLSNKLVYNDLIRFSFLLLNPLFPATLLRLSWYFTTLLFEMIDLRTLLPSPIYGALSTILVSKSSIFWPMLELSPYSCWKRVSLRLERFLRLDCDLLSTSLKELAIDAQF